ncbi:hypothetical protein X943_002923 [Babesia divergens]|uniref:Uncharacterized protein n=1 Tax=Babesia divergens TaxID=32595 RepID=A0AAD9GFZ2_BABDI|nr:hypothetical protein X943_002923 [Babesia divergens]
MELQWSKEETAEFLRYARGSFNAQDRAILEKRLRDGTEQTTSAVYDTYTNTHRFQRNKDDVIGECVDEVWDSDEQFAAVVQEALESASGSYERAKERGFKDGLKLPKEVDKQIMTTAWKHALTNALIKASLAKLQRICVSRASDGALCAISGRLTLSWEPSYLVEEDYCDLEPNVIYDIMNNGVGVIKAYTGINAYLRKRQKPAITREMEFMQYSGVFNKNQDKNSPYEGCSTLWIKAEHLLPQHQKETLEVVNKLKRVPFELCKRCNLMVQIISYFRIILMENTCARIKRHQDVVESGVIFTLLYIASIQSDKTIYMNAEVAGASRDIKLQRDMLIIVRSNVHYEIKPLPGKMFIISAWITGAK